MARNSSSNDLFNSICKDAYTNYLNSMVDQMVADMIGRNTALPSSGMLAQTPINALDNQTGSTSDLVQTVCLYKMLFG